MASRARRAPRRVIPGEIDVFVDMAFVNEVNGTTAAMLFERAV